MELKRWESEIETIVRAVSRIMLDVSDVEARTKSSALDVVTQYDVAVQRALEVELRALIPEAGFLGEEEGADDHVGKPYFFVVDPIDGTSNFVADYRHSAISVALVSEDGDPLIGVCYNPYLDECFTATRGGGAFLNGARLAPEVRPLEEGLVLFGTSPYDRSLTAATFTLLERLFRRSRDIRRSGAAVLDICYVAAGRGDLFFEWSLAPWDYAAAALVAGEAGVRVSDFGGRPLDNLNRSSVIVAPEPHHALFMTLKEEL